MKTPKAKNQQQIQQMKESQQTKKSSLWRFIHETQNLPNPQLDLKAPNLQQPGIFRHSKGLGIGKKYVQECLFRRQPDKQRKIKLITEQQIRSSRVYIALQEELKIETYAHLEEMAKLSKIQQQERKIRNEALQDASDFNKHIWQLKNEILELSTAIQEEEQIRARFVEEFEGDIQLEEDEEGGGYGNGEEESVNLDQLNQAEPNGQPPEGDSNLELELESGLSETDRKQLSSHKNQSQQEMDVNSQDSSF